MSKTKKPRKGKKRNVESTENKFIKINREVRKVNIETQKGNIGKDDYSQKGNIGKVAVETNQAITASIKPKIEIEYLTLNKLKLLIGKEILSIPRIVEEPSINGYCIEVSNIKSKYLLITKRGKIRSFKTIDSAFKTIKELGLFGAFVSV